MLSKFTLFIWSHLWFADRGSSDVVNVLINSRSFSCKAQWIALKKCK